MTTEDKDLATHVEICAIRYKGLEDRMTKLEKRLDLVESNLQTLKQDMMQNFHEIKMLIEKQSNTRQVQWIASAGAVIVAIVSAIGFYFHK